jgi:UDP-glucuronate 4-epimerase
MLISYLSGMIRRISPRQMKNILVTGGAGFIGSHLVDRLLTEGAWRVSALDNFNGFYAPEIKRANLAPHAENACGRAC